MFCSLTTKIDLAYGNIFVTIWVFNFIAEGNISNQCLKGHLVEVYM